MTTKEIHELVAGMSRREIDDLCYEIGQKGDRILTCWSIEDFEDDLNPMPTRDQFADFAPWAARKASFNADWEGLWKWYCESNGIDSILLDEEDGEDKEDEE